MLRRRKRNTPGLNTAATADISFLLLIFFLISSSMDGRMGLARQLPPAADEETADELMVAERNVLQIEISADNRITVGGEQIVAGELSNRVADFVENADDNPSLPEKSVRDVFLLGTTRVSDRHVISLTTDPRAAFDVYFQVQNAVARGYALVRDRYARQHFGCSLSQCNEEQRSALQIVFPQRISEQSTEE